MWFLRTPVSGAGSRGGPARLPADVARCGGSGTIVVLATLTLALGVLVYATDRDSARSLLFPAIATLSTGPIFGAIGPWLPSFVHPFAFSLLTAAAMKHTASPAYGACAIWWAVNVFFEFTQHPWFSGPFAAVLNALPGETWLARAISNYALRGSFHVDDLMAATAGALAAAGVLACMHQKEGRSANVARVDE